MNFSQEIVCREFQLIRGWNFDPSTGVSSNGAVNIVTRSGSNDFHGSAYYYYRDHNMAAYPGLIRSAAAPSPFFQRKNPGVWVGGPIKKEKLFFFGSYEHMGQTSVITDQNDLASMQPLNGIFPSPLHYNWITARFDYHLNDKHNMFLRFSHDGNKDFGPYTATGNPSAWIYNANWSDQYIYGLTSTFTPNLVTDFRAVYHFWQNEGPNSNPQDCVAPCYGSGLPSIISMVGSGTFTYGAGNDPNGPQYHQNRSYEATDTVTWQKGQHRIRFGADFEHTTTAYKPWDKCDPACISVYSVEQTLPLRVGFPAGALANLPTTINPHAGPALNPLIAPTTSIDLQWCWYRERQLPRHLSARVQAASTIVFIRGSRTRGRHQSLTVNFGLGYDIETGLFGFFEPPRHCRNTWLQL